MSPTAAVSARATASSPLATLLTPHRRIIGEAGLLGLVVGLLVVAPWTTGGYLLLLDWVSGPYAAINPGVYGLSDSSLDAMPWRLGIGALRELVGPQVTAWLVVLLPFPIAAAGAAHLVRMGRLPSYVAALAAVSTPLIVDRVLAGHVAFLLGLSLLPWLLSSALNARAQNRWFSARTAGWFAVSIAVSPHQAWLGGVVLLIVTVLPRPRRRDVVRLALTGLAAAGTYAYAAAVVWAGAPTLRIGTADLEAFATVEGPGGLLPTVLSLHGYWRDWDGQVRNVLGPAAVGVGIALLVAVVLGLRWLLLSGNRRGPVAIALIASGAVLAIGAQGPLGFVYEWLFLHIPLFETMREPAKWLGLVQLGYVLALAAAVQWAQQKDWPHRVARRATVVALALLPLASLPALAWGAGGSITTSTFPASWEAAGRLADPAPARLLMLPWHGYQPFSFTDGRTVATPAAAALPEPVLSSRAVELGPLRTDSTSRQQAFLDELIAAGGGTTLAADLAGLGVTTVMLSRGADDDRYAWLADQPGLTEILRTDDVLLYRVDVAPAGLDRLVPAGPAAYTVAPGDPGTVILPVEYSEGWTLDGAPGRETPQGTIAFEVGAERATIEYQPWSIIRTGIYVSIAALALIVLAGVVEHRRDLGRRLTGSGDHD
jgi:hypothetical protein